MEMTQKLRQAVKEYKEGKTESFTALYEESNKYIYTCIYKVLSGNDNAQELAYDMLQDTYVEISKNLGQLDDDERFFSWAGTIARRKCYAYIKKNKKYVLLNEEDDTFENLSDSDDIIPEEVMQSKEKQRLIREIIDTQLTEMQKLCLIAYYYNEQKQSEIAEELGIPENTVKTNLSRAKAKIKEGVLDLEKNKGTKLYSVAPLFLLLFKEDIMAAVVPQEIGARVVASVAETGANVVEAGTSASTVAAKAGGFGKMAATSIKAKILMGVATVAVAGTIGGVAIASSQMGTGVGGNTGSEIESSIDENIYTEVTEESESDSGTEEKSGLATIQEGIAYIEGEYYFVVPSTEYLDTTYADGEELDVTNWERIEKLITIHASINMFDSNKNIMGYLKPEIQCIYISTNGEWSRITYGTDLMTSNGSVFVRTEDLKRVTDIEWIENTGTEMSDEVEAYFDRIRNGVVELNKTIKEYAAEHPDVSVWYLEEADSLEGMELIEGCILNFDEGGYNVAMDIIRDFVYNRGYSKYYIEYVGETNDTVEFNIYGRK